MSDLDDMVSMFNSILLVILLALVIGILQLIIYIALSIFMIVMAVISLIKSKKMNDPRIKKIAILSLISSIGQAVFSLLGTPIICLYTNADLDFWNILFRIISYILIGISLALNISAYDLILKKTKALPRQD